MKNNNNKSGHIQSCYFLLLMGLANAIMIPVTRNVTYPIRAQYYAIQRYGDHVAPLTEKERAEWYNDMAVEGIQGKKPSTKQYAHFIYNYKNNVFFGRSPRE